MTKDGNILLKEMQIQHPTASLIARTAVAQEDTTGDGTTSVVILAGELLRQSERYVAEGLHPRVLVEGIDLAHDETLKFLDTFAVEVCEEKTGDCEKETLLEVAQTSLKTKVSEDLAEHLAPIVVEAVLTVRDTKREDKDQQIDLHMIEMMIMTHKSEFDTKLVKGLVLDHGARHPNMSKRSENCFILTCNILMEWEKTMINSSFLYKDSKQREELVKAERKHVNSKVNKVIELKKKVCVDDKKDYGFVVINQNGIDPIALDMLQKNGIVGIRRAKRRNMERIPLACGGFSVVSEDSLEPDCLGFAKEVYEHTLGDDKFTFVEGVSNPYSCTILINGPNQHTISQISDAVKDALRAVKNVFVDRKLVYGAGCFEAQCYNHLMKFKDSDKVKGRKKLGVQAFADSLIAIPRILAQNAGHDQQDCLIKLLDGNKDPKKLTGLDLSNGNLLDAKNAGIYDNYCVKKQFLHLGAIIAQKLLLVDEIMRAGRSMKKN